MTYRPAQPGDHAWDNRLAPCDEPVTWDFESLEWHPAFEPDYSPDEMEVRGVFGGAYWGGPMGEERRALLGTPTKCDYTNIRGAQCARLNQYGRPASLKRDWWLNRRLITVADPLGWYEWFWWYSRGRRIAHYDQWQIERWSGYLIRQTAMYRVRPYPGTAQALLHWGIRAERYEDT